MVRRSKKKEAAEQSPASQSEDEGENVEDLLKKVAALKKKKQAKAQAKKRQEFERGLKRTLEDYQSWVEDKERDMSIKRRKSHDRNKQAVATIETDLAQFCEHANNIATSFTADLEKLTRQGKKLARAYETVAALQAESQEAKEGETDLNEITMKARSLVAAVQKEAMRFESSTQKANMLLQSGFAQEFATGPSVFGNFSPDIDE